LHIENAQLQREAVLRSSSRGLGSRVLSKVADRDEVWHNQVWHNHWISRFSPIRKLKTDVEQPGGERRVRMHLVTRDFAPPGLADSLCSGVDTLADSGAFRRTRGITA